jgi:hypothetical protein
MVRRYLLVLALLAACEAYAALRYVVYGPTPVDHLPAYVTNKALALAALALLGVAVASRGAEVRRFAGLVGFALTGVHAVLSLAVLSPDYLPELFRGPGAGLRVAGEAALLAGAVALALLVSLAWPRGGRGPSIFTGGARVASVVLLALVGLHVLALGSAGWLAPASWPGGLPPISLLAFAYVAGALTARILVRRHA